MAIANATLQSDVQLAHRKVAVAEVAALNEIDRRDARRRRETTSVLLFVVGMLVLVFAMYWYIRGLRRRFADAYAWWDSPAGYLSERTQRPDGNLPGITVSSAAVSFTNPILAGVQGLLWQSTPVRRQAGLFLLEMAAAFGKDRNLTGIHWNGSEEQLRYADLHLFLPTGPAAVAYEGGTARINWAYVVEAFNATSTTDEGRLINPWAGTLWADETGRRLMGSPAIVGYLQHDPQMTRLVKLLYRGGLCAVAHEFFDENTYASDVVYFLVGEKDPDAQKKRSCTVSDRVSDAVQGGATALGLIGVIGRAILQRLGPEGLVASLVISTFGGAALGTTVFKSC